MTDRELLELAAKAAGHTGFSGEDYQGPYFCIPADPAIPRSEPQIFRWLTDDGDALRLAVATGVSVHTARPGSKDTTVAVEWVSPVAGGDGVWVDEPIGSDRNHDTRRAIVRAAAEIQIQKERNE